MYEVLVKFRFSKDIENFEKEIEKIVKNIEFAEVRKIEFEGSELKIEFRTQKVNGADAILRIKNILAKKLEKFGVGVRGINTEIKAKIKGNFEQIRKKIGNVKIEKEGENAVLTFENITQKELKQRVVQNVLKLVKEEEIEEEGKVAYGFVIKRSRKKKMFFNEDPAKYFEEKGYAVKYPGKGQWTFKNKMITLLRTFEGVIIERILKPMKFEEWIFPRLVPLEVMAKMPNYFGHLPQGMFYVCAGGRDPKEFEEFANDFKMRKKPNKEILKKILPPPNYVLDPAQCTNFYQAFEGKKMRKEELPIKVYERGGWTWRNEGGGVAGLARTNEFWRLEVVYMGYPEQVMKIRRELLERTLKIAEEIFDLEWKIVVGAPFYATPEKEGKKIIDIRDPERVETYDLEAYLPYRGDREKEWLEIAAFNVHGGKEGDPFARNFRLKDVNGNYLWTGCTGYGITRWITAFLAQKGFDEKNWPEKVREEILKK